MSYTPFARWRNFTLENLKAMLELYPDLLTKVSRDQVADNLEGKIQGYKRTAYQWGCQLGIESRSEYFESQYYLYMLDDEGLKKYLNFWFKMYVCPNPYVNSDDKPCSPFVEIAERILADPHHSLSYTTICDELFGEGKSIDIFKNALIAWGSPLVVEGDKIFVLPSKVEELRLCVAKVKKTLPMKDNKNVDEFFNRFSCEKFMEYYSMTTFDTYQKARGDMPNTNNKEQFRIWFTKQKKGDGSRYSENAINTYIYQMDYGYRKFNPYKNLKSVFDIQTVDDLQEYMDYLFNEDGFDAFNEKAGNRACSSGLSKYKEFLKSINALMIRPVSGGLNKIYYGAPGCGKSRFIKDNLENADVAEENIIRTTFHPEYSNCDFIGQILPVVETKVDEDTGKEKDVVKYIFNPGSFTIALQTAYNTSAMVYLIVEEINRGNASAIFGDMFQLLDRVKDSSKPDFTASEYPVANPNMQKYLREHVTSEAVLKRLQGGVYIPSNLTILATMNSSDQNVFTLDTAFKRRWAFEQISNNILTDADHPYKMYYIPGTDVTWETFMTKVNAEILRDKLQNQTNEDKRLGKYFVSQDCLTEEVQGIDQARDAAKVFAYKVLEYIWNDVCKMGRDNWFDISKYATLEDLIEAFLNPGAEGSPLDIFKNIDFKQDN